MNLSELYQDTAEVYAALAKDPDAQFEGSSNDIVWAPRDGQRPSEWRFLRLVKQPTAEELRVAANLKLKEELGGDLSKAQYRNANLQERWFDCLSWDCVNDPAIEHRRKPAPVFVPFTFADKLCGKVFTLKTDGEPARSMATRQDRFGVYLAIGQVRYADLLTGWTLDGRPAGKEQP